MRKAPRNGYNFGAKRHYRRAVWNTLTRHLGAGGPPPRETHALLLPSSEAAEIDIALDHGFVAERLHVVDANAAIVAWIRRRYPSVNTYGCDVVTAARRIAAKGIRLNVVNLDLCGPVSGIVGRSVTGVLASGAVDIVSAFAVTMLRGREKECATVTQFAGMKQPVSVVNGETGQTYPDVAVADMGRLMAISTAMQAAGYHFSVARIEKYRSTAGNQTMLWIAGLAVTAEIHRRKMLLDAQRAVDRERLAAEIVFAVDR